MHWCRAVKVMVKGLRLAFEEGEEAGCDRDVIDNCCGLSLFSWSCTVEICWNPFVDSISKLVSGRRVYSELRIFTAVGNRIPPIANPLRRKAENRSSLLRGKKATLHRLAVEQAMSNDLWRSQAQHSWSWMRPLSDWQRRLLGKQPSVQLQRPKGFWNIWNGGCLMMQIMVTSTMIRIR